MASSRLCRLASAIQRASPDSVNESARADEPTAQTAIARATGTIRIDTPHTASHQPLPRPHVNLEQIRMNRVLVVSQVDCQNCSRGVVEVKDFLETGLGSS